MMIRCIALLLLAASPALAEPGLPPEAAVIEALDTHPSVLAARARLDAARAAARGLAAGPHEVVAQGLIQRRDVRGIGLLEEYDVQVSRILPYNFVTAKPNRLYRQVKQLMSALITFRL